MNAYCTAPALRALALATGLILMPGAVHAAPQPIAPPSALPGDGLNAQWVEVTTAPHNIQMALDALAGTVGTGVVQTVNQVAPYIDYRDFDPSTAGHFDSPDLADPFPSIDGSEIGRAHV